MYESLALLIVLVYNIKIHIKQQDAAAYKRSEIKRKCKKCIFSKN